MSPARKAALVGAGLIGAKRIRAFPPNWKLEWIVDIDRGRAEALAADDASIRVTDQIAVMLADDSVDVVLVATTHASLTDIAQAAVGAGKSVFLEKPGGMSVGALAAIAETASVKGLRAHVGYNHRFHPAILAARDLATRSDAGKLMWVRGRYGHGGRLGYEGEWRAQRELSGGGELIDQGSHLIDLSLVFDPGFEVVFADLPTLYWKMDVEDNAFIFLRSPSGSRASLHASWTEWKNLFNLEICFERLKLDVRGLGGSYGREQLTVYWMQPEMGPPPSDVLEFDSDESWKAELADFESALSGAPHIGCDITEAVRNLKMIEAAYNTSNARH